MNENVIPESDWVWQGHPGHFIGADNCRFHLATRVGGVLVSTIGEYRNGREAAMEEIGHRRYFETMVFKIAEKPQEGCECTTIASWSEIDFQGYNDAAAASRGHLTMCRKWASRTTLEREEGE